MLSVWLTAWLISLLPFLVAYKCARRVGLSRVECILVASVFFPSPVLAPAGNRGAFIYLFDAAIPLAVWLSLRRWKRVPSRVQLAAGLFTGALGALPLLTAVFVGSNQDKLMALTNFYRVCGAMALLCTASTLRLSITGIRLLLAPISALSVVLLGAMVLESTGLIESNLFYALDPGGIPADSPSVAFDVAGLFRGSMGVFTVLGFLTFLAAGGKQQSAILRALAIAGGIAASAAMLLVGSKTSLAVTGLATVIHTLLLSQLTPRRILARLAAVMAVTLALATTVYLARDSVAVVQLNGILQSDETALNSFGERQSRWMEAIEIIERHPYTLVAYPPPEVARLNVAHYHNEYIGLVITGGFWGLAAYLAAIGFLYAAVRRAPMSPARTAALLALTCGIIQAATVVHLYPGVYFAVPVAMSALLYGLAANPGMGRPVSDAQSRALAGHISHRYQF